MKARPAMEFAKPLQHSLPKKKVADGPLSIVVACDDCWRQKGRVVAS